MRRTPIAPFGQSLGMDAIATAPTLVRKLTHRRLGLQTELQTNHAAQEGIGDYRATLSPKIWRTGSHA